MLFGRHPRPYRSLLCYLFFYSAFIISQAAMGAVPDSVAAIAGTYAGRAYNGNTLDPVITVFSFDSEGRFSGSYRIEDEQGSFEGRLSGLFQEGDRRFSMEWTDRDGEGFLYIEFTPDYSGFDGVWTNTNGYSELPWNGRRQ